LTKCFNITIMGILFDGKVDLHEVLFTAFNALFVRFYLDRL